MRVESTALPGRRPAHPAALDCDGQNRETLPKARAGAAGRPGADPTDRPAKRDIVNRWIEDPLAQLEGRQSAADR
jgi:hypothetical protein